MSKGLRATLLIINFTIIIAISIFFGKYLSDRSIAQKNNVKVVIEDK